MTLIFSNKNRLLFTIKNSNQPLKLVYGNRFITLLEDLYFSKQKSTPYKEYKSRFVLQSFFLPDGQSQKKTPNRVFSSDPFDNPRFRGERASVASNIEVKRKDKDLFLDLCSQSIFAFKSSAFLFSSNGNKALDFREKKKKRSFLEQKAIYFAKLETQVPQSFLLLTSIFTTFLFPKIENSKRCIDQDSTNALFLKEKKRFPPQNVVNHGVKSRLNIFNNLKEKLKIIKRFTPKLKIWGFAFGSTAFLLSISSILQKQEQTRGFFTFSRSVLPGLYLISEESSWECFENIALKHLCKKSLSQPKTPSKKVVKRIDCYKDIFYLGVSELWNQQAIQNYTAVFSPFEKYTTSSKALISNIEEDPQLKKSRATKNEGLIKPPPAPFFFTDGVYFNNFFFNKDLPLKGEWIGEPFYQMHARVSPKRVKRFCQNKLFPCCMQLQSVIPPKKGSATSKPSIANYLFRDKGYAYKEQVATENDSIPVKMSSSTTYRYKSKFKNVPHLNLSSSLCSHVHSGHKFSKRRHFTYPFVEKQMRDEVGIEKSAFDASKENNVMLNGIKSFSNKAERARTEYPVRARKKSLISRRNKNNDKNCIDSPNKIVKNLFYEFDNFSLESKALQTTFLHPYLSQGGVRRGTTFLAEQQPIGTSQEDLYQPSSDERLPKVINKAPTNLLTKLRIQNSVLYTPVRKFLSFFQKKSTEIFPRESSKSDFQKEAFERLTKKSNFSFLQQETFFTVPSLFFREPLPPTVAPFFCKVFLCQPSVATKEHSTQTSFLPPKGIKGVTPSKNTYGYLLDESTGNDEKSQKQILQMNSKQNLFLSGDGASPERASIPHKNAVNGYISFKASKLKSGEKLSGYRLFKRKTIGTRAMSGYQKPEINSLQVRTCPSPQTPLGLNPFTPNPTPLLCVPPKGVTEGARVAPLGARVKGCGVWGVGSRSFVTTGSKRKSVCSYNTKSQFSIKVPPAVPFYQSKIKGLRYAYNPSLKNAFDFPGAKVAFPKKSVSENSSFFWVDKNRKTNKPQSIAEIQPITALKKMPYRELFLNEKGEVEPLFEEVNNAFRISPYQFVFKKSLFSSYNDYLSWPKDNPVAISINPFILPFGDEEEETVKKLWLSSSPEKGGTSGFTQYVDLHSREDAQTKLVYPKTQGSEKHEHVREDHPKQEIQQNTTPYLRTPKGGNQRGTCKDSLCKEICKGSRNKIARNDDLYSQNQEKDKSILHAENVAQSTPEKKKSSESSSFKSARGEKEVLPLEAPTGGEEEEKKREITKAEWLEQIRESEQLLEKRKDLQRLAYSNQRAFSNRSLQIKPGKIRSLLVTDRKASFFGIVNLFPKRLVSKDQKQISSQILQNDQDRRSVSLLESLHQKRDDEKRVLQINDSLTYRSNKTPLCKNQMQNFVGNEKLEEHLVAPLVAPSPLNPEGVWGVGHARRAIPKSLSTRKSYYKSGLCTCKPLSFKKRASKKITRQHPVYTPNRRLRLRVPQPSLSSQNNNSQARIDDLNLSSEHRWWQKRRIASSLLGAPSKRYLVMPEITLQDWRKIIEWQLKIYFLEEERRLLQVQNGAIEKAKSPVLSRMALLAEHGFPSLKEEGVLPVFVGKEKPSGVPLKYQSFREDLTSLSFKEAKQLFKIKKLAIYLPWTTLKKSLKKPFEWPVTLLSHSSFLQRQRRKIDENKRSLPKRKESSIRNRPFGKINTGFPKVFKQLLKSDPIHEIQAIAPPTIQNSYVQNFVKNKKADPCFVSPVSPYLKTVPCPFSNFHFTSKLSSYSPQKFQQIYKLNESNPSPQAPHPTPQTPNPTPLLCVPPKGVTEGAREGVKGLRGEGVKGLRSVYTAEFCKGFQRRLTLKQLNPNHAYKPFLFEAQTKDSYLLLHGLALGFAIKSLFEGLYKTAGKLILSKIKNSSLSVLLLPLLLNTFEPRKSIDSFDHLKNRLKDLAGSEDTVSSLSEIVWYLRNSCRGRFIPRGVVLSQRFSSESTSFLKAIGGEAQVPVIVQSLRALPFTQNHPQRQLEKILAFAQKRAPCILFLDDLDSIGESRTLLLKKAGGTPLHPLTPSPRRGVGFGVWGEGSASKEGYARTGELRTQSKVSRNETHKESERTTALAKKLWAFKIASEKPLSSWREPSSKLFTRSSLRAPHPTPRRGEGVKGQYLAKDANRCCLQHREKEKWKASKNHSLKRFGSISNKASLSRSCFGNRCNKFPQSKSTQNQSKTLHWVRKLREPNSLKGVRRVQVANSYRWAHPFTPSLPYVPLKGQLKGYKAKLCTRRGTCVAQEGHVRVPLENLYDEVSIDRNGSSCKSKSGNGKGSWELSSLQESLQLDKANIPSFDMQNTETEKVIQQRRVDLMLRLLTVMDGISGLNGVLVVTTSQNPSKLDPALLRPGRFEKLITLKLPNKRKRIRLLKLQTARIGHTGSIPWKSLGTQTEDMTGTEISSVVNHSAFRAILQSSNHTGPTLEYGVSRVAESSASSYTSRGASYNKISDNEQNRFSILEKPVKQGCCPGCPGCPGGARARACTRKKLCNLLGSPLLGGTGLAHKPLHTNPLTRFCEQSLTNPNFAKQGFYCPVVTGTYVPFTRTYKAKLCKYGCPVGVRARKGCKVTKLREPTPQTPSLPYVPLKGQLKGYKAKLCTRRGTLRGEGHVRTGKKGYAPALLANQNAFYQAGEKISQLLPLNDKQLLFLRTSAKLRFAKKAILAFPEQKERGMGSPERGYVRISHAEHKSRRARISTSFVSKTLFSRENKPFVIAKMEKQNRNLIKTDFVKNSFCSYGGQAALALYLGADDSFTMIRENKSGARKKFKPFFVHTQKPSLRKSLLCNPSLALQCTFSDNKDLQAFFTISYLKSHFCLYSKGWALSERKKQSYNPKRQNVESGFTPTPKENFANHKFVSTKRTFLRRHGLQNSFFFHKENYNDFSYYNMVLTCFYVAFQNCTENRELLDFFTDHLIRFKSLKLHEMLRIASFYY